MECLNTQFAEVVCKHNESFEQLESDLAITKNWDIEFCHLVGSQDRIIVEVSHI